MVLVVNDYLLQKLELVNQEVDSLLSTSPLIIRKYMEHLITSKGKGVRALSVLTTSLNDEGVISDDSILIAASLEILHLATLVHDDVMDDADTRRGVHTLHKKYGRKTAVICGDYLLALAMHTVVKVKIDDQTAMQYTDILMDLVLGELNQHLNNGNLDLSMSEYMSIIEGKTAKLFEASFVGGALTLTNDEKILEQYRMIGNALGMIFQISDDLIDFEDTQEEALKPVQSDFEQGVITLPLIYAFEQEPELKKKSLTRTIINEAVKRLNGVEFARKEALRIYGEAMDVLESMDLDDRKRESIKLLFERAIR